MNNLQFRDKKGRLLFEISGEFALVVYNSLKEKPNFTLTTRKIFKNDKNKSVVLECINDCGYTMNGMLTFLLNKGEYIVCELS